MVPGEQGYGVRVGVPGVQDFGLESELGVFLLRETLDSGHVLLLNFLTPESESESHKK